MHSTTTPYATYKQSDERPALTDTLQDTDGNAVDLSNAQSIRFLMQSKADYQNNTDTLEINASASFIDAANGGVEYVLKDGDLNVEPGRYYAVWQVSWPDQAGDGVADDQTFPQNGVLEIDVEQSISGSVDPDSAPADLTVTRLTADEISGTVADGNVITNLVGDNLSVDASGVLNASGGGVYTTQTTVTAAYTASDEELVCADASGGAFTITLPAPAEGVRVGVEKTDTSSNTVTINPNASESVNYGGSESIGTQEESLEFISDGTDWFVVAADRTARHFNSSDELTSDVNNSSVSTAELLGTYHGKVRAISEGEVVDSIDPANTTTPFQDAIDAINAGTGNG